MKRRTILRRSSVLGAAALAGCLSEAAPGQDDEPNESDSGDADPEADAESQGDDPGDDAESDDDGAENDDGDESDSDETDGDEPPELTDSAIDVTEVSPGQEIDEADIEFDSDANAVVAEGTIHGRDACRTAALGNVDYDAEDDELSVDIVTTAADDADDRMCAETIVEIDYAVRVQFENGLPSSATVSHDGRAFVSAGHGSSSASASARRPNRRRPIDR